MMAAVVRYLRGDGRAPTELLLARAIRRYGTAAVSRELTIAEIYAMSAAEALADAWASRERATDEQGGWAAWAARNKAAARLLARAEEMDNG